MANTPLDQRVSTRERICECFGKLNNTPLRTLPSIDIATSIINYEEQIRVKVPID